MSPRRRKARKGSAWMDANLGPVPLLYSGLIVLVAFLLQDRLDIRIIQVGMFAIAASFAGKRLRFGYFAIILVSVTVFHLVVPSGRVLIEIGRFAVTSGSLRAGVFKGFAIIGMVFISVSSVRADLRLPGSAGATVAKTYWAFEYLLDGRHRITWRKLLESVDELLTELYADIRETFDETGPGIKTNRNGTRTTGAGWVALIAFVGANCSLVFL